MDGTEVLQRHTEPRNPKVADRAAGSGACGTHRIVSHHGGDAFLQELFDTGNAVANRECIMFQADGSKGLFAMVLQSALADSMLHEVFATLEHSALHQLTGSRAGAFIGSFEGLGRDALLDTALNEGKGGNFSELAWQASKFLEKPEFPHVVGTGFFSAPDFSESQDERTPKWDSYVSSQRSHVDLRAPQ